MTRMNAGIILAGNQPNLINALAQSTQAADMANTVRSKNALAALYKEQGPQIVAGDQNALNALAQLSPDAAMGIQDSRQVMRHRDVKLAISRGHLQMARAEAQRAAQKHAATMSAAEAQAELQRTQKVMTLALGAQTPDEYDKIMVENGLEEHAGTFEQREIVGATLLGAEDGLKMALEGLQPPKPDNQFIKGVGVVDMNNPDPSLMSGNYQPPAEPIKPQSGPGKVQADINSGILPEGTPLRSGNRQTVYGPDGNPIFESGPAGAPVAPKMTVDAAKNSGFLIRTEEANRVLNELEDQGTEFWQQNLESVPLGIGNYFRSPEFQKFDQARRDFVNAILRRESGAVISQQEFDNANKQYFPVPGDTPEVIAQKRRNRETAIQGLRVGSGPGAPYVDQMRANEERESAATDEIPDFSTMTDEELDAYIEKMGGGK